MNLKSKKKDSGTKGIVARFILEIIGRPPEHLVETLNKLIDSMNNEKGVKVINKTVKEPVELEKEKNFYTTFAEVEVEVEEILNIAMLMFKYMPANVEIIEPGLIAVSNNKWGEILSEITRRLHSYDEVARVLQIQNAEMQRKLQELMSKEKNKEKIEKEKK